MPDLRVAILGAGKMGGILLQAFLKNNLLHPEQLVATVQHPDRAQALSAQFGVEVDTDNLAAAEQAEVILLGVKPTQVPAVVNEIAPALSTKKMLLSFAASVKTRDIEDAAGCNLAVVRAMPNTPAMIAAGITALCPGTVCLARADGRGAAHLLDCGAHGRGRRETHGRGDRALRLRAGVYVYRDRGAGRGGRECGPAARCGHAAGRADGLRLGAHGAGDRLPPCIAEGPGDDTGRLYGRRHPGARGRRPARDADQSSEAGDDARQRAGAADRCGYISRGRRVPPSTPGIP